jgi:hypothetical protein
MAMGIRVAGDEEGDEDEVSVGIGDEGGVRRKEQLLWQQERWQRGWQAIDGDKSDGDGNGDSDGEGDGNEVGDGDGYEAGGRQRGQG